MSLSGFLRVGWAVLFGDCVYWLWQWRQGEEVHLSSWHARLNVALFAGGWVLLVVLLAASYLDWRVRQRER